jgi:hypothetical protein
MKHRGRWAVAFAVFLASSACIAAPRKNGFLLEPSSVPAREIRRGGPSRSEIPALVHPLSVPAEEAPWDDDERVMGVVVGGQARAIRGHGLSESDRHREFKRCFCQVREAGLPSNGSR